MNHKRIWRIVAYKNNESENFNDGDWSNREKLMRELGAQNTDVN